MSLCVIPLFSSVYAKLNSTAAQLLLEMRENAQTQADAKLATPIEQIQNNARPTRHQACRYKTKIKG